MKKFDSSCARVEFTFEDIRGSFLHLSNLKFLDLVLRIFLLICLCPTNALLDGESYVLQLQKLLFRLRFSVIFDCFSEKLLYKFENANFPLFRYRLWNLQLRVDYIILLFFDSSKSLIPFSYSFLWLWLIFFALLISLLLQRLLFLLTILKETTSP